VMKLISMLTIILCLSCDYFVLCVSLSVIFSAIKYKLPPDKPHYHHATQNIVNNCSRPTTDDDVAEADTRTRYDDSTQFTSHFKDSLIRFFNCRTLTKRSGLTRRALGGAHIPPTKVFRRLSE